jgi:hypothetical protein
MSRLVITSDLLAKLKVELLASSFETCAILYARAIFRNEHLVRLVVRDVRWVNDDEYQVRTEIAAELKPEIIALVTKKAKANGDSLIFVHSHPFPLNNFSSTDDVGEKLLSEFLSRRIPGSIHAALLVTPETIIARVLGTTQKLIVAGIGNIIQWGGTPPSSVENEVFDRQMRAFGAVGQETLSRLKVGIVGLGGTGSVVLEQLAHLGVGEFMLIDPDKVEKTNLNRLVGVSCDDVGSNKVEAGKRLAKRINPKSSIETIVGSVLLASVAETLADTDFIFCCTDSHGSRAVINQLAYQYLVPTIDMGVAIVCAENKVSSVVGRVQMLAPGLGCLLCGNTLNPEAVRVDLLTDFERKSDPYIIGFHEPAPAVISLNSTVAAMSVTMFLSAAVEMPSVARLINYNGIQGTARSAIISPHPNCVACSGNGALARGNEWPLPARLL